MNLETLAKGGRAALFSAGVWIGNNTGYALWSSAIDGSWLEGTLADGPLDALVSDQNWVVAGAVAGAAAAASALYGARKAHEGIKAVRKSWRDKRHLPSLKLPEIRITLDDLARAGLYAAAVGAGAWLGNTLGSGAWSNYIVGALPERLLMHAGLESLTYEQAWNNLGAVIGAGGGWLLAGKIGRFYDQMKALTWKDARGIAEKHSGRMARLGGAAAGVVGGMLLGEYAGHDFWSSSITGGWLDKAVAGGPIEAIASKEAWQAAGAAVGAGVGGSLSYWAVKGYHYLRSTLMRTGEEWGRKRTGMPFWARLALPPLIAGAIGLGLHLSEQELKELAPPKVPVAERGQYEQGKRLEEPADIRDVIISKKDQQGLSKSLMENPQGVYQALIGKWERLYGPGGYLNSSLKRAIGISSPFMPYIKQTFVQQGVPEKYAFLAIPESHWKIVDKKGRIARSPAKAAGPYQFIPSTARALGAVIAPGYDDRVHPLESGRLAAVLLKNNYGKLGHDWDLTVASYNSGMPFKLRKYVNNRKRNAEGFKLTYVDYLRYLGKELHRLDKSRKSGKRKEWIWENLNYPAKFEGIRRVLERDHREYLLASASPLPYMVLKSRKDGIRVPHATFSQYLANLPAAQNPLGTSPDTLLKYNPHILQPGVSLPGKVIVYVPTAAAAPAFR